ncbi:hypothetical protein [Mesorhizobium sp. RMAD-H1]|uniref:hypothetical protein n=1 Tax=Mesorhizobium sp. RMAD-H1 TaxID=2587065 RepID=UPI001620C786|nr:hypothetical protein [Mesorhizobium sp. RMAD-H1]MBB2971623.1 hypothetical protein [Mesorhizobium sp. RMAD-H1]
MPAITRINNKWTPLNNKANPNSSIIWNRIVEQNRPGSTEATAANNSVDSAGNDRLAAENGQPRNNIHTNGVDNYQNSPFVFAYHTPLTGGNEPFHVAPVYNVAPAQEPITEFDGSNPANDSPTGQITYRAQEDDSLIEIARQLGYDENLDPEVAERLGFDPDKDYAEQYAELLTRINPEMRSNPDGLPETHVITVLSDERMQDIQGMFEILDGVGSVDDLSNTQKTELQGLVDAELISAAGIMDGEAFEAELNGIRDHLQAILPQAEGLSDLIESRADSFEMSMNGLFSGLRESGAAAVESGDWSAFQEDLEDVLRRRLNPPYPTSSDFDSDQVVNDLIAELAFYGPIDAETLKVDQGYLDALEAAQHQVMVTDVAERITDGESLELQLFGVPADRADKILVELSQMPPTGTYEGEDNPPTSRLAEIVHPLQETSADGDGTISDEEAELLSDLNLVATQAGASAELDENGRMQIPEGVSRLAELLVDADSGDLVPEAGTAGDRMLRLGMAESIGNGDGATLAIAMADHYAEKGWDGAADNMLHMVSVGVNKLTQDADRTTQEYIRLFGDPQYAGGHLEGLVPEEDRQQAIEATEQGNLEENPEIVRDFERLFAGAAATNAALEALPESLRNLEGTGLDGYERLTGEHGDLKTTLLGEDENSISMIGASGLGMPQEPLTTLTLEQVETRLENSELFQEYISLYENVSDEEFNTVFNDVLDVYDRIEDQLENPDSDIIDLPPGMAELPGPVREVLDSLEGKSREEALEALRDQPVHGAALLMTLEALENGQPNGPSGGFISREIKNSSLQVSTALVNPSPIAENITNRWNTATGGQNFEPQEGLRGQRAAAIPFSSVSGALNIWGVNEFMASDRLDDKAWAVVFGTLAGVDMSRVAAAGVQNFFIPQGRHVRPSTGMSSIFNQGGRLDRFTRTGFVNGPGAIRVLGNTVAAVTGPIAFWTAGTEFSNGNTLGGVVWTSMGAVSTAHAVAIFAGSSWAGPLGWISAAVWLGGAAILHWKSNENQRTYFEADMKSILANLEPPVNEERAAILAEGRDDFGASDEAVGRPLFPLLEQLAEYRGYDTPEEKQEFFEYILYNEEALPNDMLRELSEASKGIIVDHQSDDDGYLMESRAADERGYYPQPLTIEQLNNWIEGTIPEGQTMGIFNNPGIVLPPMRN